MSVNFTYKKILFALSFIGIAVGLFYLYALAGLLADPIAFDKPPAFVEQYAVQRYGSLNQSTSPPQTAVLTKDYFNEAALVRNVIVNGEPSEQLIRLFTHPDKAVRVKIAMAFSEVNIKLSHDEQTKFAYKRAKFWQDAAQYSADIQNALFEALIVSAKEQTTTYIPYTLAWWMQEQKPKALEILTWAAQHHADSWVRRFSVYYVVQFGESEKYAAELIENSTHDPAFKIRKEVLNQRFRRFQQMIFGEQA